MQLGREHPTLILTNQHQLTPKQLIERYGQRWGIENQLAEQIRAFHLDSLCSQVPLAVDFDVALTVLADIVYRRFAHGLHTAYRNQTPDTIRDYLIDGIGELRFTPGHIDVALRRRTHTPALLEAGYEQRPRRGSLVGRPHPQLQLPRPLRLNRITGPTIQVRRPPGSPFGALRPSGCWEATSRGHDLKPTRRSCDASGPVGRPPVLAGVRAQVDDRRAGDQVLCWIGGSRSRRRRCWGRSAATTSTRSTRFIASNEIPTVRFVKGDVKEEIAREHFQARRAGGPLRRERGLSRRRRTSAWRGWRDGGPDGHPHFEYRRQLRTPV